MRNQWQALFLSLLFGANVFAKPWDADQGKLVYMNNCVACHGSAGDGRGPASVAIKSPKPRNFLEEKFKYGETKEEIFKTITNGVEGTAMPSWSSLSVEERQSVVAYVMSLKKK